mmetsp:Transcript_82072/g.190601  ORF Transcript_82072/g.190601 Transcript_82072/m.190601 type:complete len:332 (-) Transcript_82072:75-1070(-)
MDVGDGDDKEAEQWTWVPVICVVVLTAGVITGVVSALREGGLVQSSSSPKCRWLSSRCSVRVVAGLALIAGLFGQLTALRHFLHGWPDRAPFYLMSLMLLAYSLLFAAVLLAAIGLRWKQTASKVHEAFRQSAKASLLGGLAAGLASEVLCHTGESRATVPLDWRLGCNLLGASSGLLLLGLLAAQVDGQARLVEPLLDDAASNAASDGDGGGREEERTEDVHLGLGSSDSTIEPEAAGQLGSWARRPSWPKWPSGPEPTLPPHEPAALMPNAGICRLSERLLQPSQLPRLQVPTANPQSCATWNGTGFVDEFRAGRLGGSFHTAPPLVVT